MTAPIKHTHGFTLIELMIVVAVVGILTAIAVPSYLQFVKRSHRADAKTALLADAQFLERNFTESNDYSKDSSGAAISLPFTVSPTSGTVMYDIVVATTASTFTLTATPRAGSTMAGDACGNLTLDNLGQQGVTGTLSVAECWNK